MFPYVAAVLVSIEGDFSHNIKPPPTLISWFEKYFKEAGINKFSWISFMVKALSDFTSIEENLIKLSCNSTLERKFGSMELIGFWISVKD